jgi:diguanylate cyclase (GGDEF)-like protein
MTNLMESASKGALAAQRLRGLPISVAAAVLGAAGSIGVAVALQADAGAAAIVPALLAALALAALAALALDRLVVRHLRPLADEVDGLLDELERTRAQLEGLALKDSLTGLLNASAFTERLGAELRRAQREGYRVAVVALGLDHFRGINEGWGRPAGDEALRLCAERIASELRPADICGRIGGDEFMIALVQTGGRDADEVVERVRDAIASVEFNPTADTLTASAGFALFPYDAAEASVLMQLAELALRRAKAEGRDRATAYADYTGVEPLPLEPAPLADDEELV